jgi:hypothetical protein
MRWRHYGHLDGGLIVGNETPPGGFHADLREAEKPPKREKALYATRGPFGRENRMRSGKGRGFAIERTARQTASRSDFWTAEAELLKRVICAAGRG